MVSCKDVARCPGYEGGGWQSSDDVVGICRYVIELIERLKENGRVVEYDTACTFQDQEDFADFRPPAVTGEAGELYEDSLIKAKRVGMQTRLDESRCSWVGGKGRYDSSQ